jgi:hypothetical protein
MRRREGFTLADTMAAMLIISLAMVGLLQGTQMIARVQRANAVQHESLVEARALQATLQAAFRAPGADDGNLSRRLRGDSSRVAFACGSRDCSAALAARAGRNWLETRMGDVARAAPVGRVGGAVRFVYVGRHGHYEAWPADSAPIGETLRAVRIEDGERPLASVRVWLEQSVDCNYDLISHQCRAP